MEAENSTCSDTSVDDTAAPPLNCKINLVNVHYPGYVKKLDKVLETLGGIESIERASSRIGQNLELRFRPQNLYCKPIQSDRDSKPQILLKANVRKVIKDGKVVSSEIVDYDIAGISAINYKFNKLCDYQYLPLVAHAQEEKETDLEYIYNKIMPNSLPTNDWINSDESATMPLFFAALQYSKTSVGSNQLYFERSKHYEGYFKYLMPEIYNRLKERETQPKEQSTTSATTRCMSRITYFCTFDDDVPTEPKNGAFNTSKERNVPSAIIEKLKKLFEERPICSKLALLYFTGLTNDEVRFALPLVAFYYVSGPWRAMWVRFGYDPKNEPGARKYQTFDYRVRTKSGFKINIKAKRNPKGGHASKEIYSLTNSSNVGSKKTQENAVVLRVGLLPAGRQMIYQYCDIRLPEIEAMISRLPQVTAGNQCHWKYGWLPRGFADHCREAANKYVREFIREESYAVKTNEPELSSSSSEESDSDLEENEQNQCDNDSDIDDTMDLEALAEINSMLNVKSQSSVQPGPSR